VHKYPHRKNKKDQHFLKDQKQYFATYEERNMEQLV